MSNQTPQKVEKVASKKSLIFKTKDGEAIGLNQHTSNQPDQNQNTNTQNPNTHDSNTSNTNNANPSKQPANNQNNDTNSSNQSAINPNNNNNNNTSSQSDSNQSNNSQSSQNQKRNHGSKQGGPKVEPAKREKLCWSFKHYDIDQMRSFRFPDPTTISKHLSEHNRDKFLEFEANILRFKPSQTAPSLESQIEKELILELNKFTPKNLWDVFKQIMKRNYRDEKFLSILAKVIMDQVKHQSQFPDLYSLFVYNVLYALSEDPKLSELFNNSIIKITLTYLRAPIPKQKIYNSYFNYATFYGCLAQRQIIPISDIFDLIQFYLHNQEPDKIPLVIIAKILVPCGKLLEEFNKQFFIEDVAPPLEILKNDRKISGELRYFVYDLLDAREKGWDTKHLMSQTAQFNIPEDKSKPKSEKIQNNYTSKFAGLLDEVDEEESGDEFEDNYEFNSMTILGQWIVDHEISEEYNPDYITKFICDIVTDSLKVAPKAANFFQEAKNQNKYDPEKTFQAIKDAYVKYSTTNEFPHALTYLSIIFAKIVEIGDKTIDDYQTIFIKPNLNAAFAFLQNLPQEQLNLIKENNYWQSYKWVPENLDAIDVLNQIPETFDLEYFPLYNYLTIAWNEFYSNNNNEEDNNEEDNNEEDNQENIPLDPVEIAKQIQEKVPENILKTKEFAQGIVKIILNEFEDPNVPTQIVPLFKDFQKEILDFIQKYGKEKKLTNLPSLMGFYRSILK